MTLKKKKILFLLVITIMFTILFFLLKNNESSYQKFVSPNKSVDIVLFGDSHTANGNWPQAINQNSVLSLGWGGYTSEMLIDKIDKCIPYKPKYVFILCGGNDIFYSSFSVENTLNNFKFMTETLRNNDITPVFQKLFYQHDNSKFNDSIDSLNRSLSQYCLRENIDLIDIGKEMHDAMGLKANLTTDNLHLNQNGYLIWEDALKNYLKHK